MAPSRQRQVEIPTWRSKCWKNPVEFPVALVIPSMHEIEWMKPGQWLGARLIILEIDQYLARAEWPQFEPEKSNTPQTHPDVIEGEIFDSTSILSVIGAIRKRETETLESKIGIELLKSKIRRRNELARTFNELVQKGFCPNGPGTKPQMHPVPTLTGFLNTTAQAAPNMAPSNNNIANDRGARDRAPRPTPQAKLETFHVNGTSVSGIKTSGLSGPVDIALDPEVRENEGPSETKLQGLYTEEWLTLPVPHEHSIESSTSISKDDIEFDSAVRQLVAFVNFLNGGNGSDFATAWIRHNGPSTQERSRVPRRSKSQRK